MAEHSTIIVCPHCGTKNRLRPRAEGICRMVSPAVERLGRDLAGRLKVVKLNVDEAPALSERFQVRGIPLLVVFRDGAEADRLAGAVPQQQLRAWLEPPPGDRRRARGLRRAGLGLEA